MKRIIALFMIVFSVLSFSNSEITGKRIQVRGVSKKEIMPNSAKIALTIQTENESLDKASAENSQILERYKRLLAQTGTKYNKINSIGYSTYESYEWDTVVENKGKKEYQTKLSVEVDRISLDTLKNFMNILATEKIYSLNRSKNGTYIFTVESQNVTNKQAYQNAMSKFNNIQQKLSKAGIPANTVKISGYDNKEISLEKRTSNKKNIQVVSHQIEVETRDLKNLGNIINVASALGIGTTGQIEYDIDNKQQLENELYENAYKEALKKAQVILGKTDLNLKNPVTITDKSYGIIQPYYDYNYNYYNEANYATNVVQLKKSDRELLDESSRRNIVISPKKLNISKTVYIEFEIN
ncbi:SIMPL domain-containing protein [Leptotrichia shahii]|uniref:SIMPL domain-containing protein n=1 Tax=Leptotrichia shahii TaxID=157691 RepID=UPI0028D8AD52|nr:SIMPL domain-containing protein [Leptotrichia shahii]